VKRLYLALSLAAALAAAEDAIPKHPRELKFAPLAYAPPHAADFRHKLASGSVAFLVEDHELPLVNISVIVRTGEYLDPQGKKGVARLTGSQIRAGGTKSKPPEAFDDEAAFLAANISSGIGPLEGNASLNCLAKDVDAGLALFIDMLRNPGFAEDRLKLARTQSLQAMERRNDSTTEIETREFERLLRGPRHFSTVPMTKASLDAITREDLIAFHDKYYYPANFILAVSGDFKTAEMLAKLDKAFAGWPNRKPPVPPPPTSDLAPTPGVCIVGKEGVNPGRVRMGPPGVMITSPDHMAIPIMNGILGGSGFTSRITSRVRSDEGLAYQAASVFHHGNFYEGSFATVFQSRNPTVAQAISIIKEEIERIRTGKVSAEELKTEIGRAVDSFPRRFGTAGLRASQFADDYYTKLPADYWDKYRSRVQALTADELQRIAQKYLHPDQLVILIVGDADAIVKGNPDKPEYSLEKQGSITRIPLPDPLTMVYP